MEVLSSTQMRQEKIIEILHETLHAEHGSALEMLATSKNATKSTHVNGYFHHAKDEYNHSKTFQSLLSTRARRIPPEIAREYRFSTLGLIKKGYVSKKGFLIETMKLKDFIAYVYTNELLAEDSFSKILKLLEINSADYIKVSDIMKDELRHHGMAKEYFLRYYPTLQPWQLKCYKLREIIKNKTRIIYYKNIKFLDKIFNPIYILLSFFAALLLRHLNVKDFNRKNKNLMNISYRSMF
tara:strand:- start:433 stop:1149 length:717 start_codon:yes stop_codon:yes gene_type:complete